MELYKQIESKTGANPQRWVQRIGRYLKEPEQRQHMNEKLIALLMILLERARGNNILEQATLGEPKKTIDESGLATYDYYLSSEHPAVAISILPENTTVKVIKSDPSKPQMGGVIASSLHNNDPGNYHYIVKGVLDIAANGTRVSAFGLSVNGQIDREFISKSPFHTNNQESGGIAVDKFGKLNIVEYPELVEGIRTQARTEQAVFVANDRNWRDLAMLPEYNNRILEGLFIGKLLSDNEQPNRIFVSASSLIGGSKYGIQDTAQALDDLSLREGYSGWELACVDVGVIFAGMVRSSEKSELMFMGLREKPSNTGFRYKGGKSLHHFDFSWSKENK
jgi:hypothetical protein